jgi:N-acetylmuramic acid 6-phosphate (MurNAc-6-P) etherase
MNPLDGQKRKRRTVETLGVRQRDSVLDCGDVVFGVAASGRGSFVGGALRDLERCQSQSGDFADSVTAVQNLAADSTVQG